ncbi:MAG: hypothetical protein OHK0053_35210 [Microscillaceae bacterium]
MIQNLKDLIESLQASNIRLALHLIEGGGVGFMLLGHLLALKNWYPDGDIQKKSAHLFYAHASGKLGRFIAETWSKEYYGEFNEVKVSEQLDRLRGFTEINLGELAWMSLKLRQRGGKFCLENKVGSNEQILREIKSGSSLFLSNFELNALPQEVGLFTDLTVLNISGNHFRVLPEEIGRLRKLEKIYFVRTPLLPSVIRWLENTFPRIFAEKYYYEANDLKSEEQYLKAYLLFVKSQKMNESAPESWHQAAKCLWAAQRYEAAHAHYLRAHQAYEKVLRQKPHQAYYWFAKASILARWQQKKASQAAYRQAVLLNPHYRQHFKEEEDFQAYWQDADFAQV